MEDEEKPRVRAGRPQIVPLKNFAAIFGCSYWKSRIVTPIEVTHALVEGAHLEIRAKSS
jgi:hypothetical protein